MFEYGAKVICIDSDMSFLVKGDIHTITGYTNALCKEHDMVMVYRTQLWVNANRFILATPSAIALYHNWDNMDYTVCLR